MRNAKRRRFIVLVSAFGAIAPLLAGCGSSRASGSSTSTSSQLAPTIAYNGPNAGIPSELPVPAHKAITVGYLQAYSGVSTLVSTQNAIKRTVEELGGKFVLKDANLDPQKQVSQLNELISQHVDEIAVFPIDPAALAPSLAKAKAAGISVIAVSATLGGDEKVPDGYFATIDLPADRAAFAISQRIAKTKPGASVVVLGSTLPVPAINYPTQRSLYWAKRFGLKVLGEVDNTQDNPGGYTIAANTVAARYPKADAVLAYNDAYALTVSQVLRSSGHPKMLVTGNNGGAKVGFDAVAAGKLDCVYSIPWDEVGVQAAYAAYAAKSGTKIPTVIIPQGQLITAKNAKTAKAAGE